MAALPVSAETTVTLYGSKNAGHRENIADIVIDDQHLLARQHGAGSVKLLNLAADRFRSAIARRPMQEEGRLVGQGAAASERL
jgi:hypothetical protein